MFKKQAKISKNYRACGGHDKTHKKGNKLGSVVSVGALFDHSFDLPAKKREHFENFATF